MRVLVVIGTRPEAIKLAPVVAALAARPGVHVDTCITSQHTDLLRPMLEFFELKPVADLQVMASASTLEDVAAKILTGVGGLLREHQPDVVIVQGDTTTAFAAGLAAFYQRVPVAHVEAGLRSHDMLSPFPEEAHRRFVDLFARYLFAPTEASRSNLLAEGLPANRIWVTGNTGIDALLLARQRIAEQGLALPVTLPPGHRLLLVTAHRRESFGPPLDRLFQAVRTLADRVPNLMVLAPLHPNQNVRSAGRILAGHPRIHVDEPLDFPTFVAAMSRADLILTDSGGVQEEAPVLGTPVLVARDNTERPEGKMPGLVELVGTDVERIVERALALLAAADRPRQPRYVYGDGRAADRIAEVLTTGEIAVGGEFVADAG